MRIVVWTLTLALLCIGSGRTAIAATTLLGDWVDPTLGIHLQFLDDTHLQLIAKNGSRTTTKYSIQPPDQLTINNATTGDASLYHYRIASNRLVLIRQVTAADQFFGVKKYNPETLYRK